MTHPIDQNISDLQQQIERHKLRAMQRYFESGSQQDYIEGQRAIGAERALRQLTSRLHNGDPDTPEWARPLLQQSELDLRACGRSDAAGMPDLSARFRRRGGRA